MNEDEIKCGSEHGCGFPSLLFNIFRCNAVKEVTKKEIDNTTTFRDKEERIWN